MNFDFSIMKKLWDLAHEKLINIKGRHGVLDMFMDVSQLSKTIAIVRDFRWHQLYLFIYMLKSEDSSKILQEFPSEKQTTSVLLLMENAVTMVMVKVLWRLTEYRSDIGYMLEGDASNLRLGLISKVGKVQKVCEWSSCPFAKMIPPLVNHFGIKTAWLLIYFLNYAYFDI